MNVLVTCRCKESFAVAEDSIGDMEDEDGAVIITCPFCLREFDPYEELRGAKTASDETTPIVRE